MKKILKITGLILGAFVLFVSCYLAAAYLLSRWSVEGSPSRDAKIPVYILTNGVHTDIVVPVRTPQTDWSLLIPFANTHRRDTAAPWLGFGWGDKGFYLETPTWADLTFATAFKAVFGLSTTAIHATYHDTMNPGENCRLIRLTPEQYAALTGYIMKSFRMGREARPVFIRTRANYGNDDAFYEARGSYSLFHTCNTWSNNALKACGQRACLWTPFDKGIFYQHPIE